MYVIQNIFAREILDSRGFPTIEIDLVLSDDSFGRAAAPSGSSVGSKEALELRDHDLRFLGRGVLKAVSNVNNIINVQAEGKTFENQEDFDQFLNTLDGTANKSKLGANAMIACSLAFLKASANSIQTPFYKMFGTSSNIPRLMMNIINGGKHADNLLDIQEFMIIPMKYESVKQSIQIGAEIFHHLRGYLKENGHNINVGDEGGVAPNFCTSKEALDAIMFAIKRAGYIPGIDVSIAIDAAASEFYYNGMYELKGEDAVLSSEELMDYFVQLSKNYPIISLEDPMSEFDHKGWQMITEALGGKMQIVGDDLFVTNEKLLQNGIDQNLANSILIKLNQIGTVTETINAIDLAHQNNFTTIISHRSGETEDTIIAHLAVGSGSWQIKAGGPSRTDRVCKYNELIRIEEQL